MRRERRWTGPITTVTTCPDNADRSSVRPQAERGFPTAELELGTPDGVRLPVRIAAT